MRERSNEAPGAAAISVFSEVRRTVRVRRGSATNRYARVRMLSWGKNRKVNAWAAVYAGSLT